MSLPHFYLDNQVLADETSADIPLRLNAEDAKHFKVLRLKRGEHIAIIDASRDYFECEITDENWDAPKVRICKHEDGGVGGPTVLLVQGLAKGDKMDTVVRGATEIGVAGIVAAPFKRCVVELDGKHVASRLQRWETIAKSASMQSGRRFIPEVTCLGKIAELQQYVQNAHAVLVFWEEAPLDAVFGPLLLDALGKQRIEPADARVVVIVGPEGGLEASEVDWLQSLNPNTFPVTLGNTILRTETAGIIAPAMVLYELGALGGGR